MNREHPDADASPRRARRGSPLSTRAATILCPCLVLSGVAACGGGGGAAGTPPPPEGGGAPTELSPDLSSLVTGTVVAAIEVEQPHPHLDEFVLRATLPVPPGTFLGAPGDPVPLGIEDLDGTLAEAQVERVSGYPRAEDGADVVEVIARVQRDPEIPQGEQVVYRVVAEDSPPPPAVPPPGPDGLASGPKAIPAKVKALLESPHPLLLAATDLHGNAYLVDLLESEGGAVWKRFGRKSAELRTYGTMEPTPPVEGATATLPHLFGVHAYLETTDEEPLIGLDLRVNNGPDGNDTWDYHDDPMGDVYFDGLYLLVPKGWYAQQSFEDPGLGKPFHLGGYTVFPLVAPLEGDALHLMPANSQFHRRLVLSPVGEFDHAQHYAKEAGRGFCIQGENPEGDAYWSWFSPDTPNYFPQSRALPNLDHLGRAWLRDKIYWELDLILDHLTDGTSTGTYPFSHGRLGWAHPFGVPYGGMTSGTEIHITDGIVTAASAARHGYRLAQVVHRMATDRMPNAYYAVTGEPTRIEDWILDSEAGPYIPMSFAMELHYSGPDPMGYDVAPTFQVELVEAQGRQPDYEDTLRSYQFIDLKHLVRYTRNAKILAWLGNDSLAADDLRHQAELFHLTYGDHYNNPWAGKATGSMKEDRLYVDSLPSVGFKVGRGEGWGLDCMNAAYRLAPEEWRDAKYDWYEDIAWLLLDGQSACNGFWQSNVSAKNLDGKYRTRQSIEQAILENAIMGTVESVYRGRDAVMTHMLEDALVNSLYGMVSPESWNAGERGPRTIIAVGPLDEELPPFCGTIPEDGQSEWMDGFQIGHSLAYGYEITGDPFFLQMAEEWVEGDLLGTLELDALENIENRSALFALAQELGQ